MSFTEIGGVSRGVVGWEPEVYGGGGFVVAVLVGVLAASLLLDAGGFHPGFPSPWLSPFTCRVSANLRKSLRLLSSTSTSPRYMNSRRSFRICSLASLKTITGCFSGKSLN